MNVAGYLPSLFVSTGSQGRPDVVQLTLVVWVLGLAKVAAGNITRENPRQRLNLLAQLVQRPGKPIHLLVPLLIAQALLLVAQALPLVPLLLAQEHQPKQLLDSSRRTVRATEVGRHLVKFWSDKNVGRTGRSLGAHATVAIAADGARSRSRRRTVSTKGRCGDEP
jgi:hypothetical protein